MRGRFRLGRARDGVVAGALPPGDRPSGVTAQLEMPGDDLWRGVGLQRLGDLQVQPLSTLAQQALVGDVLDQRVLEGVERVGRAAGAKDQLRLLQPLQRLGQLAVAGLGDLGQELVAELAADDGTDLGDLLGRVPGGPGAPSATPEVSPARRPRASRSRHRRPPRRWPWSTPRRRAARRPSARRSVRRWPRANAGSPAHAPCPPPAPATAGSG